MRIRNVVYAGLLLLSFLLSGCSGNDTNSDEYPSEYPDSQGYTIDDLLLADSPEETVAEDDNHYIHIDYSNASKGYIRIKRLVDDGVRIKIQMINNDITLADNRRFDYYELFKVGEYETIPIVYGSGNYSIKLWRNTIDTKYQMKQEWKIPIQLESEQTPFLYPNQTVDYDASTKAIAYAFTLCQNETNDLKRIRVLYDYVVNNIKYDDDKKEATQNLYVIPVIDETFETNKGICFDYAALFAAMCRSQHIPCKVVVGNTKIEYHAWVEVWLNGTGWINPEVLFESDAWTRMDPTFAASKADYDGYYETIYEY